MLFFCVVYSSTLKMETPRSSETFVDFQEIHGVTSQTIELFITTAVRTSNSALVEISTSARIRENIA
jgi:hypothetical protein